MDYHTLKNEIVVYQPNETIRLDVRFDNETVWMPQPQIAELFVCSLENVRLHLKNIYASGELDKAATSKESLEVRQEGNRRVTRRFTYYNLDAVISIGYRVNSIIGVKFRQWATKIIKERMLAGAVQSAQFAAIDRRLLAHDRDIAELKDKVDFFVQTQTPPLQGVFYDGQLWDARALVVKLIAGAKPQPPCPSGQSRAMQESLPGLFRPPLLKATATGDARRLRRRFAAGLKRRGACPVQ